MSERKIIFVPRLFEVLPCSGCFITCMGGHFPTVELDNAIQSTTLSRMSGFLWHSSKWACWFGCFLQYMPGLEVLACSLNTDLNYVTLAMPQLHPFLNHHVKLFQLNGRRKMQQLFGCILIDRYKTKQCSLLGRRLSTEFFWQNAWIFNIPSWFSFDFGLFVLSLYLWLYLLPL